MNLEAAYEEVRISQLSTGTKADLMALLSQCQRTRQRGNPLVTNPGGQEGLDPVLRALLPHDPVRYVDVGASEPIECSNTWQFYQAGGQGLLCEPWPTCWYSILLQRPRDQLWPRAIARESGWATFHVYGSCSSLDPEWTTEHRGKIAVETEPLRDVLARFPEFRDSCDLLSVDTEGTEEAVLESADWSVFRPRVVVLEHYVFSHPEQSDERANGLIAMMTERRYRLQARDRLNLIFTTEEFQC